MEELSPWDETVFVLKGGQKLGPFTLDEVLEHLEAGELSEDDVCLREGATETERLRDLLDWDATDELDESEEEDDDEVVDDDEEGDDGDDEAELQTPGPPSDRLLYAGHPSILTYPFALLAVLGGIIGGVWLYRFDGTWTLAGMGLAMLGLIRLSLVSFTHDYHIRERRIEVITGLLARSSREVRISDIRSINVTCRGLSGMAGIGTVDFITSGDKPEVSFHKVWAARRLKQRVRRLQDALSTRT